MKIVFCRKGMDASAGGFPSPIINGKPWSLPIPAQSKSSIENAEKCEFSEDKYSALKIPDFSIEKWTKKEIQSSHYCHLDPDIVPSHKQRKKGWIGAFGQCLSAQSHLENCNVGVGDVFLFFGWFSESNNAGTPSWDAKRSGHYIYGWLQIDNILNLSVEKNKILQSHKWLEGHPHLVGEWPEKNNVIYIAKENLELNGKVIDKIPGWGSFEKAYRLTQENNPKRSVWTIPEWLNPQKNGVGMSYHKNPNRWVNDTVTTVGRGQESVADTQGKEEAQEWLKALLEKHL